MAIGAATHPDKHRASSHLKQKGTCIIRAESAEYIILHFFIYFLRLFCESTARLLF